jgi:uncharacterized protein YbgA (DUF1722 family)
VKDPGLDVTDRLRAYAESLAPTLVNVAGFILMKSSPSCGLFRVKVYPRAGVAPLTSGRGIFAEAITRLRPELPVEDSGRLFDPVLCENFVTRTFAYAHWLAVRAAGLTAARLLAFHSAYKYLLMAHSVPAYREAGRLLADLSRDVESIASRYLAVLMTGLTRPATPGGHANVLQHLAGYVKTSLDTATRRELAEAIHAYRRGEAPLLAPLTLLKHHLRRFPDAYALEQIYLNPHPPSAGLRRPL